MEKFTSWFLVFYAIERLLETFWKRRKVRGTIVERYTLPLLVSIHALTYVATLGTWIGGERRAPPWMTVTGTIMVLISILGRYWAIRSLGAYHSIYVEIRDVHPLIRSGPYRFVRHPYYLSNFLEIIGLPLSVASVPGLCIAIFVYVPVLATRLIIEENALADKIGYPFLSYKHQVPKIIPKFF